MDNGLFDSINPYINLEEITARSPAKLLEQIKAINKPIRIVNIVSHNGFLVAFVQGDIKKGSKENG